MSDKQNFYQCKKERKKACIIPCACQCCHVSLYMVPIHGFISHCCSCVLGGGRRGGERHACLVTAVAFTAHKQLPYSRKWAEDHSRSSRVPGSAAMATPTRLAHIIAERLCKASLSSNCFSAHRNCPAPTQMINFALASTHVAAYQGRPVQKVLLITT